MFWLKKLVSFWLMPLPLCLALLFSGLLLSRSGRGSGPGRRLMVLAAALLALFSNKFVSIRLLRPLETEYPSVPEMPAGVPAPAALADCRVVAVLGGGHNDVPGLASASKLSTSALERIVEAVRILRAVPGARLIVSGPAVPGYPSHASVLAQAAQSLGIDPKRITLIDTARDTEDESLAIARLAAGERTALVTSAWHMPRAAGLFKSAGVDFVPCPTDFVARPDPRLTWADFAVDSESLERSTLAVHEYLGLLWLRLRRVT